MIITNLFLSLVLVYLYARLSPIKKIDPWIKYFPLFQLIVTLILTFSFASLATNITVTFLLFTIFIYLPIRNVKGDIPKNLLGSLKKIFIL